jgi:Holliday junction DNA helicase RuvA
MIASLRGVLLEKRPPWLLLEVAGVGYQVEAPMSVFYDLPETGVEVALHVHQVVREDALLLYGFSSRFERDLFRALIRVNGVGPKLALALLSGIEADRLVRCIELQDSASLVKIPGVGKKTAERLVIEMSDRLSKLEGASLQVRQVAGDSHLAQDDALAALEALGYKSRDALSAINALPERDALSAEDMIRQALKRLAR